MPGFIVPALAALRDVLPAGAGWLHEVKFDGYRLQAHLSDRRVTIYTRSGLDWTKRFPTVADAIGCLPASKLILDGEVISAEPSGRSDFSALQDDLKRGRRDRLAFYAFDLLYLDGFDLRAAPLIERKRVLASFLAEADTFVMLSEHFENGGELYARACAMGLEGVIAKRANAPYRSGRGDDWIKVKCLTSETFVIVGYVPEGPAGLAKVRVARRQGGKLVYVGRVGTGWDRKTAKAIRTALTPLARRDCPCDPPVRRTDTTWVKPRYQAEVVYSEITTDGMLRHPSFKGFAPIRPRRAS